MIDGWHDGRDSYNTLYVPFVWVLDGAPHPTEWLAEHPDAFWVPATLVRDEFAVDDASMGGDDFGQSDGATQAGGVGEPASFEESRSSWPVEDQAVPASAAPAASRYDDPVAAYLRVNDMFARLGAGSPTGPKGAQLLTGTSPSGSRSTPVPDSGSKQSGTVHGTAPIAAAPQDPTSPVLLTDDQGNAVTVDGEKVVRPAGLGPHFFIDKGVADRKIIEELLESGDGSGGFAALAYLAGELANFRQGAPWDAQRIGGKHHKEYQDYSTIAVGLYAAAAGMSETEILRLQDVYARVKSNFRPGTAFSDTYTHLPQANVDNTLRGYALYKSITKKSTRK